MQAGIPENQIEAKNRQPRVVANDFENCLLFYSVAVLDGKRKDMAYMPAIPTTANMILLISES